MNDTLCLKRRTCTAFVVNDPLPQTPEHVSHLNFYSLVLLFFYFIFSCLFFLGQAVFIKSASSTVLAVIVGFNSHASSLLFL